MSSGFSLVGGILSVLYLGLAVIIAVFADRLYKSRPIGLWGDVAVAVAANVAFAVFLGDGWHRMLLSLNDAYPAYYALAYVPLVAFVAIGFVRSLVPLIPARAAPQTAVMAMAGADVPGTGSLNGAAMPSTAASPDAAPATASAAPTAQPPSRFMRALQVGVGITLLAVLVLIGVAKFITRNDLPACDSSSTRDTLSDIFKSKKIEVKRYDSIKTNSSADTLITCTAYMTMMDNHPAEIDYQIGYIENKQIQVRVTGARDK